MGNRAHVIFHNEKDNEISPAVYLHWNGGPASVYSFLDELERRKVRNDVKYGPARFAGIVMEFFDSEKYTKLSREWFAPKWRGGLSVLGVTNGPEEITPAALEPFNHGDNGVYVVATDNGTQRMTNHGTQRMRRFMGYPLDELSPEDVAREESTARKDFYMCPENGIPSVYDKTKPIEGEGK